MVIKVSHKLVAVKTSQAFIMTECQRNQKTKTAAQKLAKSLLQKARKIEAAGKHEKRAKEIEKAKKLRTLQEGQKSYFLNRESHTVHVHVRSAGVDRSAPSSVPVLLGESSSKPSSWLGSSNKRGMFSKFDCSKFCHVLCVVLWRLILELVRIGIGTTD